MRNSLQLKARLVSLFAASLLVGCNSAAQTDRSVPGTALARIADWEWQIAGTCEYAGEHMTFTAPGDPSLTIGFNSEGGTPSVVGNFSSQSKGFMSIIGHPETASLDISIGESVFEVSGPFFVDTDVHAEGEVSVTCGSV